MRRPRERGHCSPRNGAMREDPARLSYPLITSRRGHWNQSCAPRLLPLPPILTPALLLRTSFFPFDVKQKFVL